MNVIINKNNLEQKEFFEKLKNLPVKFETKKQENSEGCSYKTLELINFCKQEIELQKLINYFYTLNQRYNSALFCLEEIKKECEVIIDDSSKFIELYRKMESNNLKIETIIQTEYFIFAINSCLDIMAHIVNIIYTLGIPEKFVSFENVFVNKIFINFEDDFVSCYKQQREKLIDFRKIRNRMTHHQILDFSTNTLRDCSKVTYLKYLIKVYDETGKEISKPLLSYFEDVIKNFDVLNKSFYIKLNSVI